MGWAKLRLDALSEADSSSNEIAELAPKKVRSCKKRGFYCPLKLWFAMSLRVILPDAIS